MFQLLILLIGASSPYNEAANRGGPVIELTTCVGCYNRASTYRHARTLGIGPRKPVGCPRMRESSRVMLKLPKRLLQVERLCSLCGLGKMII